MNHSSGGSVYVPPHANHHNANNGRNGSMGDTRYSKDQLLDLFRAQQDRGSASNLDELFVDGWNPKNVNGASAGGWGRPDDRKDILGPEICWDQEGAVQPLGLIPMTNEEKEVFSLQSPCFRC